ncbi:MAG: TonB-dependent receptor [Bacteroidales bacterium]|nr:TonB-dependent receptor [Bacteroidales bacterium]
MMKRWIFIAGMIVSIFINGKTQIPQGRFTPENMPKDGSLKGKIVDSVQKLGIEYASIGLYRLKDSSLVSGTITDVNGEFLLSDLPYGGYYIEVSFVGYKTIRINKIRIIPAEKNVDLGEIIFEASVTAIKEVEVVAEKNHVEYKIDKKVVNISQDLTSTGGSAAMALENVPSIQADIEGNITLRGSSNFRVLIDGKPTVLDGNDVLQQTPASQVERIEIITNPSAKYEPDGMAGIINIIMKKRQMQGVNGIVNASIGTGDKYNGDFLLNLRTKKVNYFIGGNFNDMNFSGTGFTQQITNRVDSTLNLYQNSRENMARKGWEFKAGADYYLSEKGTLTLSGEMGKRSFGRNSFTNYHEFADPSDYEKYYILDNYSERAMDYYSLDASYRHMFDQSGHELLFSFNYGGDIGKEGEDRIERNTDLNWNIINGFPEKQRSREDSREGEYRAKVDYTQPLSEHSKFEAGYQLRLDIGYENYGFETFDPDLNSWFKVDTLTNRTETYRDIQSLYGIYSNKILGFEYQVGLRFEYTDRRMDQLMLNQSFRLHRFDYFPSVHISRELPADQQVQLSYSRRINRPRTYYLDPFPSYMDSYNIRIGNPELEPEYADSYELNYQKRFGKNFISFEGYFRQTNNLISRVQSLGENNIFYHTFENIDKDYSTGMEIMGNVNIFKWWLLNGSANVFYYKIEGDLYDSDVSNNTFSWNTRINTTFNIQKYGARIQLNGMYNGPTVTAQGDRNGFYFVNAAVRKDLLKNQANVTFQVRDIFQSFNFAFNSSGENFTQHFERSREAPVFTLSFTYRINNFKQKRQAQNGNENIQMDFEGGEM